VSHRAVFFDFGGVLYRQDWAEYDAFARAWGLPEGTMQRALYGTPAWRRLQVGEEDRETWRASVEAELRALIGERAGEALAAWWTRPVEFHHRNLHLANALRATGLRVGVLSNAGADLRQTLLGEAPVAVAWDTVVVSGEVGLAKPDAAIYRLAAERFALPTSACFFIDDSRRNVEGAQEAGMSGHHFTGDDYEALEDALRQWGGNWAVG
jgi:FMN phosphatase YigB (HAD superfamily)